MSKKGKVRADKVQYKDGIGCCIWQPFPDFADNDGENTGICFDFDYADIDDYIAILQELKTIEAEEYSE